MRGATTEDRRQASDGSSSPHSDRPAPGPTYLARQARTLAESHSITNSLRMFVDGVTTPGAQANGARDR